MQETISTTLNGKKETLQVSLEASALEVIREDLGLTGTKLVCGSGACGACTVLVNGAPTCSCLMPATQMAEKEIQTVEFHGRESFHPIQKAFLAHDGLQCGYCTPGFINEGVAFYDQWRKEKGKKRPSREQVAEAMAGHLCRCAAYQGIYEAIQSACAGDFDGSETPEFIRVDGPEKVTGEAKYTTDISLPGQLTGRVFRSPYPRARLKSLDFSKAESLPGVKAVIRLKADELVRYEGEPLAAVAAATEEIAQQALAAIEAEFEPLPFVVDYREALKKDAPLVFPNNHREVPVASEGPKMPGSWEGNLRKTALSLSSEKKGKAKKQVKNLNENAASNFSATFSTPTQLHTCLEPHCAVAEWTDPTHLKVYASTQAVYWLAHDLAKHYKLKPEDVEVIGQYVGGAFGSKLTLYTAITTAVDLAQQAGAPVAVIYDRAEELTETGFRAPADVKVTITCNPDGTEPAYTMDAYASSGIAIGSNLADVSGLAYTGISKKLQDYDIVTNFAPGCAFRAPGAPAAAFALEQSVDALAHQLGKDPLAFRKIWEQDPGYRALFDWVEKQPLWQKRKATGSQPERFRTGIGLAFAGWLHIYMPTAEVKVSAGPEGISVSNGVQDMGQGAKTVLAQAVSDVFGIPNTAVRVVAGNSQLLVGPTSGGSRTATTIYPAAYEAALKVRDRLVVFAAEKYALENARVGVGGIEHAGGNLSWQEALKDLSEISETVKRGTNDENTALGLMPLPQGMSIGKDYSAGCYLIEVEVDTLLGKTRVTQVAGCLRAGKIHVRQGALSQCYGGVIQGIGHVLYEDRYICPSTGRNLSRGLEDYRIPGIGDVPEIHMDFLEEGFDFVKGKGIGIAELCTIPIAGAVANAVFNATGWRPLKAPILPQDMIAGLSA